MPVHTLYKLIQYLYYYIKKSSVEFITQSVYFIGVVPIMPPLGVMPPMMMPGQFPPPPMGGMPGMPPMMPGQIPIPRGLPPMMPGGPPTMPGQLPPVSMHMSTPVSQVMR